MGENRRKKKYIKILLCSFIFEFSSNLCQSERNELLSSIFPWIFVFLCLLSQLNISSFIFFLTQSLARHNGSNSKEKSVFPCVAFNPISNERKRFKSCTFFLWSIFNFNIIVLFVLPPEIDHWNVSIHFYEYQWKIIILWNEITSVRSQRVSVCVCVWIMNISYSFVLNVFMFM